MVASIKTAKEILSILQRHVEASTLDEMLYELSKVKGDKQFVEVIEQVDKLNREEQ